MAKLFFSQRRYTIHEPEFEKKKFFINVITWSHFTNQMRNTNYLQLLKEYFRHVSAQVYVLQGEQNVNYMLLFTRVFSLQLIHC